MDEREGGTSQFVLSFEREGGDVASFDGAKIAHFPKERAIALKKKKKKKTLATRHQNARRKNKSDALFQFWHLHAHD